MRPGTESAESSLPLLQSVDASSGRLSFANLVEAHILDATRHHNFSHSAVGIAIAKVRKRERGAVHPLLTREFQNGGIRQFVESLESSIAGSRDVNCPPARVGNLAADLDHYLERIERDANDDPYQLFPMRNNENKYVVLNIGLAAGHPVIAGTGLRVQHLSNLIRGGLSSRSVADYYGLNEEAVVGALAFLAA